MTVPLLHIEAIVSDPALRGGQPIIAGTSVRVIDLVAYYHYAGKTPEELAAGFSLSLGQVHVALAYYHLHKDEIDAEMRADAELAEQRLQKLARQGRVIPVE